MLTIEYHETQRLRVTALFDMHERLTIGGVHCVEID